MKRIILSVVICLLAVFAISCGKKECVHEWKDATCTQPKTCTLCGVSEGEVSHAWVDATCEKPMTCTGCMLTKGEALGHSTTAGVCDICDTDCVYEKLYDKLKTGSLYSGNYVWARTFSNGAMYIGMDEETEDMFMSYEKIYSDLGGVKTKLLMEYIRGASSYSVKMLNVYDSYGVEIISSGVIYPSSYSPDEGMYHVDSFETDVPDMAALSQISMDMSVLEMFEQMVLLIEDSDITMEDLGFTAYQAYLDENNQNV